MLFAELLPVAAALKQLGLHITVETAGTLHLPVVCDLMSISPKLVGSGPSSGPWSGGDSRWSRRHHRQRHRPEVISRLIAEYDYQLKFVIDQPAELNEVAAYLREFPQIDFQRVLMMPQGVDEETLQARAEWLKPACVERGWTFCPRRQIEWFGAARRT